MCLENVNIKRSGRATKEKAYIVVLHRQGHQVS
jgi:hypothetical protein